MTLDDDDMFAVVVWYCLGTRVPTDMTLSPCQCSAGVAASAYVDHAMVCKAVAKMTQICRDTLAEALRLDI